MDQLYLMTEKCIYSQYFTNDFEKCHAIIGKSRGNLFKRHVNRYFVWYGWFFLFLLS